MTIPCPTCENDKTTMLRASNGESRHECKRCLHRWTMIKVHRDELTRLRRQVISLAYRMNREPLVAMRVPHKGKIGETAEQWNRERKPT